jgi:SAM-dependent methyltransferase
MDEPPVSWATRRPLTSPFALPSGLRGRLAGRFMLWTNRQDDLLDVLDVRPGDRLLEVGHGAGGLIRRLAARTEVSVIYGVEPSEEMRSAATRLNREAVRSGRVQLRLGDAARTGLPRGNVDLAVSVNSVALWPDLDAGLAELSRVLRPGGRVVIAWHGGTAPSAITRRLRLPPDQLDRVERALERRFSAVTRRRLRQLEVLTGVR